MSPAGNRKRNRIVAILLVGVVAIVAAVDLAGPRTSHLRRFDPVQVAHLETAMWRSYYDRKPAVMFGQLALLLRDQYRLPYLRSNLVALYASRAAFTFKKGHNRADYERAIPDLILYYRELRKVSDIPFDVNETARLELEWWIIHRERKSHAPGDLAQSLAALQHAVYGIPEEKFAKHAELRAEAMTIRDDKAAAGGVTEEDWTRIEALLVGSWRDLHEVVNERAAL